MFLVGPVPDSSAFTSDCTKLLVAIEAEPCIVDGAPDDPEGGVAILDFNGVPNPENGFDFVFVDFQMFDARYNSEDCLVFWCCYYGTV